LLVEKDGSRPTEDKVRLGLVVTMLSERLVAAGTVLSESPVVVVVVKVLRDRLVVVATMLVDRAVEDSDVCVVSSDSAIEEAVSDIGTSNGGSGVGSVGNVGRNSVEDVERTAVSIEVSGREAGEVESKISELVESGGGDTGRFPFPLPFPLPLPGLSGCSSESSS
jgi:hypothetical protein